jgi:hypothetical protein
MKIGEIAFFFHSIHFLLRQECDFTTCILIGQMKQFNPIKRAVTNFKAGSVFLYSTFFRVFFVSSKMWLSERVQGHYSLQGLKMS